MSKISTYTTSDPSLSDMLIGTDANDENATKNFLIADILDMVEPLSIPSGEYTPSIYTISNVSTINSAKGYYAKFGSYVGFSVKFEFSSSGSMSSFKFSIPISSSFTANYDAIGSVSGLSLTGICASIAGEQNIVITTLNQIPVATYQVSVSGFYKIK